MIIHFFYMQRWVSFSMIAIQAWKVVHTNGEKKLEKWCSTLFIQYISNHVTSNTQQNVEHGHPGRTTNNHALKNASQWKQNRLSAKINSVMDVVKFQLMYLWDSSVWRRWLWSESLYISTALTMNRSAWTPKSNNVEQSCASNEFLKALHS